LEALVKSGQTKGVGISNFTLDDVKTLLQSGEKGQEIKPVVNQVSHV
jgi:diketogulonate reductase-like aldo/keto reductase